MVIPYILQIRSNSPTGHKEKENRSPVLFRYSIPKEVPFSIQQSSANLRQLLHNSRRHSNVPKLTQEKPSIKYFYRSSIHPSSRYRYKPRAAVTPSETLPRRPRRTYDLRQSRAVRGNRIRIHPRGYAFHSRLLPSWMHSTRPWTFSLVTPRTFISGNVDAGEPRRTLPATRFCGSSWSSQRKRERIEASWSIECRIEWRMINPNYSRVWIRSWILNR